MAQFFALIIFFVLVQAKAELGFFPVNDYLPSSAAKVESVTSAVFDMSGSPRILGTAFLIKVESDGKDKRGFYITNAHVLEACHNSSRCHLTLEHRYRVFPGTSIIWPLSQDTSHWSSELDKIVFYDEVADLAVFTSDLPNNASDLPVEFRVLSKPAWTEITTIANPNFADGNRSHLKDSILNQEVWSKGKILYMNHIPAEKKPHPTVSYFAHDADTLPGSSGGPVIDQGGKVVGINTLRVLPCKDTIDGKCQHFDADERNKHFLGYAIPVDRILSFLEKLPSKH